MGKLNFNADDYYSAMKKLLPSGPAWELDDNSFFMKMLKLASLEFARLDSDIQKLLNESDPQTASATLQEWFNQWGIPEECYKNTDADIDQLRDELILKIRTLGFTFSELVQVIGQQCGYTETKLDCANLFTCNSTVNEHIYSDIWRNWYYAVTVNKNQENFFLANTPVNKRLNSWSDNFFECLVKHYAPAHTGVIFQYGEEK